MRLVLFENGSSHSCFRPSHTDWFLCDTISTLWFTQLVLPFMADKALSMKKWKHPVLPRHCHCTTTAPPPHCHCTTTTHCWSWHCHVLTCRALWLWSRHQWRTVSWSSISRHGDIFASRLWTQHTLNVWACILVTSNSFGSVLNWVVCCCSCSSAPQPNSQSRFTPSQKSAAFPRNVLLCVAYP